MARPSQPDFQKKASPAPVAAPSQAMAPRPFLPHADVAAPAPQAPDVATPDAPALDSAPAFPKLSFQIRAEGGSPPPLQPKLTIGAPNDKYEQEADRVAAQVVQRIHAPATNLPTENRTYQTPSVQRQAWPEQPVLQMKPTLQRETLPDEEDELQMKPLTEQLQRMELPEDDELQMKPMLQMKNEGAVAASDDLESAIQQSRGGGQPLADSIREPMEQAFGGVDFSGVNVHTDGRSDELNRSVQAKAFTTGQDIFFRQGAYQPGSQSGHGLLAHELTHVLQQNGEAVQRSPLPPQQLPQNPATETPSASSSDHPLQAKGDKTGNRPDSFREQRSNRTGIPATLKAGIENLSGYYLDDVRAHYNSPRPIQLQAYAYTQGSEIHVAPGQKKIVQRTFEYTYEEEEGEQRKRVLTDDEVKLIEIHIKSKFKEKQRKQQQEQEKTNGEGENAEIIVETLWEKHQAQEKLCISSFAKDNGVVDEVEEVLKALEDRKEYKDDDHMEEEKKEKERDAKYLRENMATETKKRKRTDQDGKGKKKRNKINTEEEKNKIKEGLEQHGFKQLFSGVPNEMYNLKKAKNDKTETHRDRRKVTSTVFMTLITWNYEKYGKATIANDTELARKKIEVVGKIVDKYNPTVLAFQEVTDIKLFLDGNAERNIPGVKNLDLIDSTYKGTDQEIEQDNMEDDTLPKQVEQKRLEKAYGISSGVKFISTSGGNPESYPLIYDQGHFILNGA